MSINSKKLSMYIIKYQSIILVVHIIIIIISIIISSLYYIYSLSV